MQSEILTEEIMLGNEVSDVIEGGWSKVDVIVHLKFPFQTKNYGRNFPDIEFFRHEDPHYEREDSYSTAIYKQALAAPIK